MSMIPCVFSTLAILREKGLNASAKNCRLSLPCSGRTGLSMSECFAFNSLPQNISF